MTFRDMENPKPECPFCHYCPRVLEDGTFAYHIGVSNGLVCQGYGAKAEVNDTYREVDAEMGTSAAKRRKAHLQAMAAEPDRERSVIQQSYGYNRLLHYFDQHEPRTARVIRNGWNEQAIFEADEDRGFGGQTASVDDFINDDD